MLLSACLIVKDEELTLGRCLESLQGIADEIIVVDTGSTDKTLEIAESFDAKIYHYEWDHHFGNARNEALRHAQGDFVLIIDADEYLDARERMNLRPFLETTEAEGITVTIQNYVGNVEHVTNALPVTVVRIFRRGHQYTGAIHEQVVPSILATGKPILPIQLTVHHVGYLKELVQSRGKSDRNVAILQHELEQDPTDLFHQSNMMAEYVRVEQYEECVDLGERTFAQLRQMPFALWPHYVARIFIFMAISLWGTGESDRAMEICREGIEHYPLLTDLRKRYATMLMTTGHWIEAIDTLMQCRALGDPKESYIDVIKGQGTYYAALDLGACWLWLGDSITARKWYMTAFFENPELDMTAIPLVGLFPPEPTVFREHFESRLRDRFTYGNYAEMYAIKGYPEAASVIERAVQRFGETDVTLRARMSLLLREGASALVALAEKFDFEGSWFLVGLYYLEHGQEDSAWDALSKAGERGIQVRALYEQGEGAKQEYRHVAAIARDLMTVRAERLFSMWLPLALDRAEVWQYVKFSPLARLLEQIAWPGDTVHECEQNGVNLFFQKRLDEAAFWLEKAKAWEPTVTKVLLECDLALARGDVKFARAVVLQGKQLFPDSEMIKIASEQVHVKVDHGELAKQLGETTASDKAQFQERREKIKMNPADIYMQNSVYMAPPNVQLAQLHQRGAVLTKGLRADIEQGKITEGREKIQQMQDIIAFLRSSLDLKLEVARVTDQTYAFYYNVLVTWFLQPNDTLTDEKTYKSLLEFWESWARTWMKASPGQHNG